MTQGKALVSPATGAAAINGYASGARGPVLAGVVKSSAKSWVTSAHKQNNLPALKANRRRGSRRRRWSWAARLVDVMLYMRFANKERHA